MDATIFIEEPPLVETHDGLFFVTYQHGKNRIRFAMLPHTYLRGMQGCKVAEQNFHTASGEVVSFVRQ